MKKIQQYTKLTKNPKENLKKTNTKLKLKLKNKVNRNYLYIFRVLFDDNLIT